MTKVGFPRRDIVAVLAARAPEVLRTAALEPIRFAAILAAAIVVVTATAAVQAAALVYDDLEVIYAENLDDALSAGEHDAIVADAGQSSCGMKNTLLSDGH
jgi:hypothetical protein